MYNLWVIHVKILSGLFVIYVFLGKLQKIRALMMFVEHVYLNLTWSRCLQDSVNDRWQTSVDTKDSAHFLGILTIGITAGKGCEAFCNTDPFLVKVVWRGLYLARPFLYFFFNSVLEYEVTVCPSAFDSWTWWMQYWKLLCLCDSLQDQNSKVLVARSPKVDFLFQSKINE